MRACSRARTRVHVRPPMPTHPRVYSCMHPVQQDLEPGRGPVSAVEVVDELRLEDSAPEVLCR